MDDELKQALSAMESRLSEQIRDTDRKLLSVSYGWLRPMELRARLLPLLDERLIALEERMRDIERKLLERGL